MLQAQNVYRNVISKEECHDELLIIEDLFEDGHFEKCIGRLELLMQTCNLSRTDREHALELLAKADVMVDDMTQADSAVNRLMISNPHYQLVEKDNTAEFNNLIKKYHVYPRLSIGVRNAYNTLMYKSLKTYEVLGNLDYSAPYNHKGFSIFYYGWMEYQFEEKTSINADLIFFWSSYNRLLSYAPSFSLYFTEKDNFMEIPLYLKRYFPVGKNLYPYVAIGASWTRLTMANANVSLSYTKNDLWLTGLLQDHTATTDNIDMMPMRNKNLYSIIEGIGVGYKYRNLRLFFDLRYYGGLTSLTNEKKRFDNPQLVTDYYYIDNTVRINQFEIGVSLSYTLLNAVVRR